MRRTVSGRASSAPLHEVDIRPQRVGPKRVVEVRGGHIYTGNHITPPRAVHSGRDLRHYVRWGMDTSDVAARPSALASNLTIEMLKRTLKASAFACQEFVPTQPKGGVCEDRPSQQKRVEVGLE